MNKLKLFILAGLLGVLAFLVADYNYYPKEQSFLLVGNISLEATDRYELLQALKAAKVGDTINIDIRSLGGSTLGAAVIVSALHRTNAIVNIYVGGYAMSAGAVIACHGSTLTVSEYAQVGFHLSRTAGEGGQVVIETNRGSPDFMHWDSMFEKCKRFLTSKQLKSYYTGEDVLVSPEQMNKTY